MLHATGLAAAAPALSTSCSSMWAAMARAVGCSNSKVGERERPATERSRDASSVAASESTPASMSGVSATSAAPGAPVSSRTTSSTADST